MLIARLLVALPLASLLGFFLPGYFVARCLRSRDRLCVPFVVSILVLYYGAFFLRLAGLPIRLGTMLSYLLFVTGMAAVVAHRTGALRNPHGFAQSSHPLAKCHKGIVMPGVIVIGAMMLLRCIVQPLAGYDTPIRWDLLASQILDTEHMGFYPPLTTADFRYYGLPDAIAPVVSFSYWWIYAAIGAHIPSATCAFIVAQYAAILVLALRTGSTIANRSAGFAAMGILVATPLLYRSVAVGQETGLTALSMVATVYSLCATERPSDRTPAILAGLTAALGVLAREYGWVIIPCGCLVLLWLRHGRTALLLFTVTACVVASPWYIENWITLGNPIYPARIGTLFAVNPVYTALLDVYREHANILISGPVVWYSLLAYLLRQAPIQLVLGPVACIVTWRRTGYLSIPAMVFAGIWLWSIGYTWGGPHYAARVLSPSIVLLSLTVGILIAKLVEREVARWVAGCAFVLCLIWAVVNGATHPFEPRRLSLAAWSHIALKPVVFAIREPLLHETLKRLLPPGARVLTDNSYAHAALTGTEFEAVMVWSPEVGFLFDDRVDVTTARQKLEEHGIRAVYYSPSGMNSKYLGKVAFFRSISAEWLVPLGCGTASNLYVLPSAAGSQSP